MELTILCASVAPPATLLSRMGDAVFERSAVAGSGQGAGASIDLLEALRQCGPCSVYALAKAAGRNDSNVQPM